MKKYPVSQLRKKGGNGGAAAGHGVNHTPVAERPIDPKFEKLPLSDTAGVYELGYVGDGVFRAPRDLQAAPAIPMNLGRLSFELRQLLEKTSTDQSQKHLLAGRLSRQWAAVARGAEDVFQRRKVEDGIDSAVFIAVDQSGSMSGRCMSAAADATRLLAEALSRCVGVQWMAATFSDGAGVVIGDTAVERASWYVFKAFNQSYSKFKQCTASLYRTRGGTPEIAALQDALKLMSKRPEQRKLLIWIADGDGYSPRAIKAPQKKYSGVTVVGIGIGVDLSIYFPHSVTVNTAADLAKASFKAVAKALAA
jgi:hypothetical protein